MDIGNEIKKLRQAKGISQKDLATALHMTPSNLSRIEKDASGTSYEMIYTIYTALDEMDPLTLKINASRNSIIPALEQLMNKIKLLPPQEQLSFSKIADPLVNHLLDDSNQTSKK